MLVSPIFLSQSTFDICICNGRIVWGKSDRVISPTDCPCVDIKSNFMPILTYESISTAKKTAFPLVCHNCSLSDFYAKILILWTSVVTFSYFYIVSDVSKISVIFFIYGALGYMNKFLFNWVLKSGYFKWAVIKTP